MVVTNSASSTMTMVAAMGTMHMAMDRPTDAMNSPSVKRET